MFKVIRKEDLITSTWSGGTTTQLFIYPEGSDYKALTFDFRISTASVDVETSHFTSLPGINRLIMSLDNPLKLSHKNQYDIDLKPFQVDSFKGDWQTQSKGKVIDFNLMYKDGWYADMGVLTLDKCYELASNDILLIYNFNASMSLEVLDKTIELNQGDLVFVENEAEVKLFGNQQNFVLCELKRK